MTETSGYSKKQISEILNKASEIQTRKDLYGDNQTLTEAELIHIANEVGIDKDSLFEAIEAVRHPGPDSSFDWLKGTSRVQDSVLTEGEVTDENWDDMVREIRRVTGGIGKNGKTAKTFEWEQRRREMGYRHISLTRENGKTRIQYVYNWNSLKFMITFMSIFFGWFGALMLLEGLGFLPKGLNMITALGGGLLTFGISRVYLKNYFETQKEMLGDLVNSLSRKLRSSSGIAEKQSENQSASIEVEKEEAYGDSTKNNRNASPGQRIH